MIRCCPLKRTCRSVGDGIGEGHEKKEKDLEGEVEGSQISGQTKILYLYMVIR